LVKHTCGFGAIVYWHLMKQVLLYITCVMYVCAYAANYPQPTNGFS